jgi:hypothetical protein
LQTTDPQEQFFFLGLPLALLLGLPAAREQLADALRELIIPLTHLDGINGVDSGKLLERLVAPDRLHGEPCLEFGAVDVAVAHQWEPHLMGGAPPER